MPLIVITRSSVAAKERGEVRGGREKERKRKSEEGSERERKSANERKSERIMIECSGLLQ